MKVFVAGAGGYIGVPLCRALIDKGHTVVALDRYFFGIDKMAIVALEPGIFIVPEDIREFDPIRLKGIEAVIDLAGLSNDPSAEIDPDLTRSINCDGGMRLALLAKKAGVRRYIYSSSASVYGNGKHDNLTEESACRPLTLYSHCKLEMEQYLNKLKSKDFETVIFRNGTVFGIAPRMRFDLAVNLMTMRAWKDKVIHVNGTGEQWRPFLHVNDVVRALILGLERSAQDVAGQTFNVGSSEMNYQIRQIADLIVDIIPDAKVQRLPANPDARTYNVSFDKIRERLHFNEVISVRSGVKEIKDALDLRNLSPADPTCYTLQWYRTLNASAFGTISTMHETIDEVERKF